jgi:hypothetical protein
MQQDECNIIYERIFRLAKDQWEPFINKVKKYSDAEDRNLI